MHHGNKKEKVLGGFYDLNRGKMISFFSTSVFLLLFCLFFRFMTSCFSNGSKYLKYFN
jgi:hypothetical protein